MVTPGRYSRVVTAGHKYPHVVTVGRKYPRVVTAGYKYLIVTGVSLSPLERGQGVCYLPSC